MTRAYSSVREAVGNTPMVHLSRFGADFSQQLYGKCEFMNPGGSIKDRIGFHLVEQAEADGLLKPGGTIVEATAGNTGLSLAAAAAVKGYRLIVVMTNKVSQDKVRLLQACGADTLIIPYSPSKSGEPDYIQKARNIAKGIPGGWFVDQYRNPHNPECHYRSTGEEIWEQMEGRCDALVLGMGTGGTLGGAARYLKERNPDIKIVLADPKGSLLHEIWHKEEKPRGQPYWVEGIGASFLPDNVNMDLVDMAYPIEDAEAIETALAFFRSEGMFVGGSSGCILSAARRYCQEQAGADDRIAVILCDSGRAYLHTVFNPQWCEEKGLKVNFPFETD